MNRTLIIPLVVVAGSLGGLLARYVPPVHAKAQAPNVEVRWQAFTLIDAEGHASRVVLIDPPHHKIWTNSNR
jgi:hypothetical protein